MSFRKLGYSIFAALFVAQDQLLFAHPGHGVDGGSHQAVHYLTDPTHITIWAIALLLAAFLALRALVVRIQPGFVKFRINRKMRQD